MKRSEYKKVLYVCILILLVQPSNDQTLVVMWLLSFYDGEISHFRLPLHICSRLNFTSFSNPLSRFTIKSSPRHRFLRWWKKEIFSVGFDWEKKESKSIFEIRINEIALGFQVLSGVTKFNLGETKGSDMVRVGKKLNDISLFQCPLTIDSMWSSV